MDLLPIFSCEGFLKISSLFVLLEHLRMHPLMACILPEDFLPGFTCEGSCLNNLTKFSQGKGVLACRAKFNRVKISQKMAFTHGAS